MLYTVLWRKQSP